MARRYNLLNPKSWRTFWPGQRQNKDKDAKGIVLNLPAAEDTPAVVACVNVLADSLASLPRIPVRITDPVNDGWEYIQNDPLDKVLNRPSPRYDTFRFWHMVFTELVLEGNAYVLIEKDSNGTPTELTFVERKDEQIDADQYSLVVDRLQDPDGSGIRRYREEDIKVPKSDVLAFHGPMFDTDLDCSPSPIDSVAKAAIAVQRYVYALQHASLKKGPWGNTFLRMLEQLIPLSQQKKDEAAQITAESFRKEGTIPVLQPGFEVTGVESPADIKLVELQRWSTIEICRSFGVPPRQVFEYTEGFRSREFRAQAEDYSRYSVSKWTRIIQSQMTRKLIGEDPAGREIRLPVDSLQRGTFSEQVDSANKMMGLATLDERRAVVRLKPIGGDLGDEIQFPTGGPDSTMGSDTTDATEVETDDE